METIALLFQHFYPSHQQMIGSSCAIDGDLFGNQAFHLNYTSTMIKKVMIHELHIYYRVILTLAIICLDFGHFSTVFKV